MNIFTFPDFRCLMGHWNNPSHFKLPTGENSTPIGIIHRDPKDEQSREKNLSFQFGVIKKFPHKLPDYDCCDILPLLVSTVGPVVVRTWPRWTLETSGDCPCRSLGHGRKIACNERHPQNQPWETEPTINIHKYPHSKKYKWQYIYGENDRAWGPTTHLTFIFIDIRYITQGSHKESKIKVPDFPLIFRSWNSENFVK
jgi:hypothetical protein